jgi:hypothetical protein
MEAAGREAHVTKVENGYLVRFYGVSSGLFPSTEGKAFVALTWEDVVAVVREYFAPVPDVFREENR